MSDQTTINAENPAETMRQVMTELTGHEVIENPSHEKALTEPTLIEVSKDRRIEDLTNESRKALEYLKPARRKGTAQMHDLQSIIDWTNRFKGETSALFALPDMQNPSLTSIVDYHAEGPIDVNDLTGDPSARHCHHRAVYKFPLHDDWKLWNRNSGKPLDKDEMGEFIEAQASAIQDPTPALINLKENDENTDWENRLIRTANHIEGRFGQVRELLAMSRHFQVYETSNLEVATNRDTGESAIQFLNEHRDKEGAPIKIPNLITIAIPVFVNGAPYRMPVRFRYRKSGSSVKFILSIYNPEKVFEDAFKEAIATAQKATELPAFLGTPET